jgi:hypothetical protein
MFTLACQRLARLQLGCLKLDVPPRHRSERSDTNGR